MEVVIVTRGQPPAAGITQVIRYDPGVLSEGVISPLTGSIERPGVEEKTPPATPVPPTVTDCGLVSVTQ